MKEISGAQTILLWTYYFLFTTDTSQLNTRKKEPIHVLISAYMRGGSTFGADLLTREQGISRVFFYEPLFTISTYGYFTGDNQLCNTLKPTCRYELSVLSQKLDFATCEQLTDTKKCANQPAHPRSLISAFFSRFLKKCNH